MHGHIKGEFNLVCFTKIASPIDNNLIGILIRGHANYAKKNKDDIVCSAISAIAQTAIFGCSMYDKHCKVNKLQEGYVSFTCKKTIQTEAIINSALLGLNAIKKTYPKCFKEV